MKKNSEEERVKALNKAILDGVSFVKITAVDDEIGGIKICYEHINIDDYLEKLEDDL